MNFPEPSRPQPQDSAGVLSQQFCTLDQPLMDTRNNDLGLEVGMTEED